MGYVRESEQENMLPDLFFLFDLMQYITYVGTEENELVTSTIQHELILKIGFD